MNAQPTDRNFLKSTRQKLAWGYALGMAVGLVIIVAGGYWLHSVLVKEALKTELQQLARKEAGVHLPDLQAWAQGQKTAKDVTIGFRANRMAFYYILSRDRELVHGNETQPELRTAVLDILKNNQLPPGKVVFETLSPSEEPSLQLALLRHPVNYNGDYLGSVYAATDIGDSLSHLDQLLTTSLIVLTGLILLATVGGWWMAHRSLRPLRLALEQQRRFVADASHELRAPLTVMTTALSLLRDETCHQLDSFHQETLEDTLDETRRLNRLAEELLLLAKADSGGLVPELTTFTPAPVIEQQLRLFQILARERGVALSGQCFRTARIRADKHFLQSMVGAALDNALTYTPEGGNVSLELSQGNNWVEILVRDTGPGMEAEEVNQAFQRFYRADPARRRNQQGSGLGLAVIEELATLQGARVKLSSAPGEGTSLSMRFQSA